MQVTLSRRGDYAVRAMLALAAAPDGRRPTSVRAIAIRMAIPVRFLPHVMADLGRAGLVLALPATSVSLLNVIDAVEAPGEPPRCVLRGGPCQPDGRCSVHDTFSGATRAMRAELAATSLADVGALPAPPVLA